MEKISISTEVLSTAKVELKSLEDKLQPTLIPQTAEEIKALDKMGNVSFPFAIKAYEYGLQIPAIVPSYQKIEEYGEMLDQVEILRQMEAAAERLHNNIASTRIKIGSIAKKFALEIYNISKLAAKQNIPGAKEAEAELGILYSRNGGSKKDKPDSDPDDKEV